MVAVLLRYEHRACKAASSCSKASLASVSGPGSVNLFSPIEPPFAKLRSIAVAASRVSSCCIIFVDENKFH